MELLAAIGHIGGSILAMFVLGTISMLIASWETERFRKQELEETAMKLGVTVDDLDNKELVPKLLQLSSDRFSNELLSNRLSDLCGVIRTIWSWLGSLLGVAVLIGVIWYTFTEGTETAVYAWLIVAISLFFGIASVVFSLVCRLLTGRYPGEAKQARKSVAEFLKSRHREQQQAARIEAHQAELDDEREEEKKIAYVKKHASVYIRAACAANAVLAANAAVCKAAWELSDRRAAAASAAYAEAKAAGATEEEVRERQEKAIYRATGLRTFSAEYKAAYAPFDAVCKAASDAASAVVESSGLRAAKVWEHDGVDVLGAESHGYIGDITKTIEAAAHDASLCHFGGGFGKYEREALEAAHAAAAGLSLWSGRDEMPKDESTRSAERAERNEVQGMD